MARWVQIAMLAAIVSLVANGQCYARCLADSSETSAESHPACHHSSHSKERGQSQCQHGQHANTLLKETRQNTAKAPAVSAAVSELPGFPVSQVRLANSWMTTGKASERAFSPPVPLFLALSVFRI